MQYICSEKIRGTGIDPFRQVKIYLEFDIIGIFYEAWCGMFENRPSATDDLQKSIIPVGDSGHIEIRPLTTDELTPETLEAFLTVGFTNHYEILAQKKDMEQRLFYMVTLGTGTPSR